MVDEYKKQFNNIKELVESKGFTYRDYMRVDYFTIEVFKYCKNTGYTVGFELWSRFHWMSIHNYKDIIAFIKKSMKESDEELFNN